MIRQFATAAIVTVAAIAANLGTSSEAMAQPQETRTRQHTHVQTRVQTHRLGIQMIARSNGLEVVSASPGSPASRLGLEAGDIVMQINGVRMTCNHDLQQALSSAAQYNNGQVRVLIDNVRARYGEPGAQRFINAQTFLNGFQPSMLNNQIHNHGISGTHGHQGHITGG